MGLECVAEHVDCAEFSAMWRISAAELRHVMTNLNDSKLTERLKLRSSFDSLPEKCELESRRTTDSKEG